MSSKEYLDLCLDNNSDAVLSGVGKNVIPVPQKEPLWRSFLRKFEDPLIIVLLVVFVFSLIVSIYEIYANGRSLSTLIEPLGVLIALLLATGVGFIFEVRAEREFRVLNQRKDERPVKVLRRTNQFSRRPEVLQIKRSDVVLGDIVKLESGDEVPADGRLLHSQQLHVDESAFTGEMFTAKRLTTTDDSPSDTAYPRDFLLRGSTVIEGNCLYQVTAVGVDTEEGHGAKTLNEEQTVRTPLDRQLDQLSRYITTASYIIATLIVIGRMVYYFLLDGNTANNTDMLQTVEFLLESVLLAVTLIVVSVPEGLPLSVTMSLAMSMRKMLKQNNLVRKLHACETMGAATVICTDKTGTLTQNKLEVVDHELYDNPDLVARSIAVNSTADLSIGSNGNLQTVGNPTEGALLRWIFRLLDADYHTYRDEAKIIEQVLFTPETKHMITIALDKEGHLYKYVKGAPEIVLRMCDEIAGGRSIKEVEASLRSAQAMGRRTLGFACQELSGDGAKPLRFVGFASMADPVRDDVKDAISTCRNAGVRVIMVTGDVALTANEIARESGIMTPDEPPQIMTGEQFSALYDDYLKEKVLPNLKVLSRARPTDKLRLVSLLQEMGEVVSVTGDGTNDALALKKAQVGLSMGDGTARAKEASDITIIDNSFASINKAILWGRSLYKNIKRFLLYQMTINICACLIVLVGACMGLDSPLNVTQMLWVNLIMDTLAAMALSSLPTDPKVMHDKPRSPKSHIIDRAMLRQMLGVGLFFFVILFGLWQLLWHVKMGDNDNALTLLTMDNLGTFFKEFFNFSKVTNHLNGIELGLFFTTFVLMQFWNLFNVRYFQSGRSLLQDLLDIFRGRRKLSESFSSSFLLIAAVIYSGQVIIVQASYSMFHVAPLSWVDWAVLTLLTLPILVIPDMVRYVCQKRKAAIRKVA